jgi:aspartate-semialdehyde dehydrogenase
VKRLHIATYQAASGAGAQAMDELIGETKAYIEGKSFERTVIPHRYAFNLFPHNSPVDDTTYCQEETKMIRETHKMFHDDSIRINAVCVRVPVLRTHSEAVNIELKQNAEVSDLYNILKSAPGLEIIEEREKNRWAMPVDMSGKEPVAVSRIRKDVSQDNTFDMWVVGDQLLKGAALNAVQIAEYLVKENLL